MNNQEYKTNETTNAIQRDLENQLRLFGASVADGVVNGFDGRGDEIGTRAKGVGGAFVRVAEQEFKTATNKQWSFRTPKKASVAFEKAASSRYGLGMMQIIFGAFFAASFLLSAVICLLVALLQPLGRGVLVGTSVMLLAFAAPFAYLFHCGKKNATLSKRMKRYVIDIASEAKITLTELAQGANCSTEIVRKDVQEIMKQTWCPLWFDAKTQQVYLTKEAYQHDKEQEQLAFAAAQVEQGVTTPVATVETLLQSIDGFISVIGKQKEIMQDAQAVEELTIMQETCTDIREWIQGHPEVAPKMRRFTSYYMPTTLKLLYSYNDVQGQQGENAQTMRRDIARFLHTLNMAFTNLHDSLLSAASLDISAEIAALQGMLAQDGLSKKDDFGTAPTL